MAITVYFSSGAMWELPENTDSAALTAGIAEAMRKKEVYEFQAKWSDYDTHTLVFNGARIDFVAIGDGPVTSGHPARG